MTTTNLTLVSVPEGVGRGRWKTVSGTGERIIVVDRFTTFCESIRTSLTLDAVFVARVIIDGSVDALTFLRFLASLPADFRGDALYRSDEAAFLSSVTRDCGRTLYELRAEDVRFYLDVHDLAAERASELPVVLIVDRDPDERRTLAAAAAAAGAEVVLATTSGEAVRIAASLRPSLVFVDDAHAFDVPPTLRGLAAGYTPAIALISDRSVRSAAYIDQSFAKPVREPEIVEYVRWVFGSEAVQKLAS